MYAPWMLPLATASASVIVLRTWLLWPIGGRATPWQRRESTRMVAEKAEAIAEAQAEALAAAWRMWLAPWSVWGPLAGRTLPQAAAATAASVARPFGRRASANARRLGARAVRGR